MSNSARVRTKNTGNSHIWQSKVCSNNNNSICDTEEWSRRGSGFGAAEHAQPAAWPLQRVSAARHRKLPRNSKIPGFVTSRLLWFYFGGPRGCRARAWPPKVLGPPIWNVTSLPSLVHFSYLWLDSVTCGLVTFHIGGLRMPDTCGGGAIHGATTERVYARRVNASRSDDTCTNHRAFSISALLKILISSFAPKQHIKEPIYCTALQRHFQPLQQSIHASPHVWFA